MVKDHYKILDVHRRGSLKHYRDKAQVSCSHLEGGDKEKFQLTLYRLSDPDEDGLPL